MVKSTKPKGAKSAYILFCQQFRDQYKKENPDNVLSFSDLSKLCSEKWKSVSENDKNVLKEQAVEDKNRYVKEMENYQPDPNQSLKAKRKMKRKLKDPKKPKRPLSSFLFFCEEHRQSIREQNPELKIGDISKVLGKMWSECVDKTKYDMQNAKDKERFEAAMKEYSTNGPSPNKKLKPNESVEEKVKENESNTDFEEDNESE